MRSWSQTSERRRAALARNLDVRETRGRVRTRDLSIVALTGCLSLVLSGCEEQNGVAPRSATFSLASDQASHLEPDVARELQEASHGRTTRGEQDEMLRVEALVPGFGGFFVDTTGHIIVLLKDTTKARVVRALLDQRYRARSEHAVRQAVTNIGQADVRSSDFSLAELVAMQARLRRRTVAVPGMVAYGPNIAENRLVVAFTSRSQLEAGILTLARLGVPASAVRAEVWSTPVVASGTWIETYRPTRAGILITTGRGSPLGPYSCSHGFNVYRAASPPAEVNFTLTAAHCIAVPFGNHARGAGDTLWQAGISSGAVRVVTVNPPWPTTNCPLASDNQPAEYCPDADVLLAAPLNGVVGERKIGTSTWEGLGGTFGSQVINGWFPIAGVLAPELIARGGRNLVHKSGFVSGTTTGSVQGTAPPPALLCATVEIGLPDWGSAHPTSLQSVEECTYVLVGIGAGKGDSGGPIFARQVAGGPYYALGITVGSTILSNNACTSGLVCAVVFQSWNTIEQWLGMGTLNPTTVIP